MHAEHAVTAPSEDHAGRAGQGVAVLLVEDDPADALLLRRSLRSTDLAIDHVPSIADAVERLGADRYDVVLLDLGLPDASGLDALHAVVQAAPSVPVVVLTGLDDPDDVGMAALRNGAQDYLVKGSVGHTEVARAVRYAIERERLRGLATARTLESSALGILESSARRATDLDEFVRTATAVLDGALGTAQVTITLEAGSGTSRASSVPAGDDAVEPSEPTHVTTVPVLGADGPIGHIRVVCRDVPLEPAQLDFLTIAADAIAGLVDRRSTELALTARTRHLRTMHAITAMLRDSEEVATVADATAAMVAATLPHDVRVVVRLDGHAAAAGTDDTGAATTVTVEHPVLVDGTEHGSVAVLRAAPVRASADEVELVHFAAEQLGTWRAHMASRRAHAEETERLRQVLTTAPVGLVVTDHDGEPLYVNPAARELLGLGVDQPFPMELVRPARLPARGLPIAVTRPDGGIVTLAVDATPLAGGSDDSRALVLALSDLTAVEQRRVALQAALDHEQAATDELRRVAVLKDTFLHAVSHELRTPLASVLGYSETLRDHADRLSPDDSRQMLGRVHRNAARLQALLEDLLDLGRITSGATPPLHVGTEDLAVVVREALAEQPLEQHELVLTTTPSPAVVDRAKVERIVDNLVRNAVRHTPEGCTIWVHVDRDDTGARLVVEDDGPGIVPELREELWLPFHQGERRTDAELAREGTGIGLSLVRTFAELHGGTATVTERVGGGARFIVTFPDPLTES